MEQPVTVEDPARDEGVDVRVEGQQGAETILYSLTESCRRLGLNPETYLIEVFRSLAKVDPTKGDAIRALTPARWKASREALPA